MLPGHTLFVRSSPPKVTFLGSRTNSASGSTYTFPGIDLGPPVSRRFIVAHIGARSGVNEAGNQQFDKVTIGGVTAPVVAGGGGAQTGITLHSLLVMLLVPSGVSADLVVSFKSNRMCCTIGWWAVTGIYGNILDTRFSAANGTSWSDNLSAPRSAVCIAGVCGGMAGAATHAWTGLGKDYEAAVSTVLRSSGATRLVPAEGTSNFSVTYSSGTATRAAVALR